MLNHPLVLYRQAVRYLVWLPTVCMILIFVAWAVMPRSQFFDGVLWYVFIGVYLPVKLLALYWWMASSALWSRVQHQAL